ncbi:RHS repeat-associated core domain-containing protein|uniref:RHS repeat-associated core domain-containing protein n=1 Tax=Pseudomonas sp. SbOxS1 TaxID=2723884 RepID=UPI0015D1EDB1|nr:RHS repeat-associated core domain-containing protein [Pseudomonas sp. SbOxS1]NYU03236.1 RHS repeat-associated core domain-containing protein [Pseudomonas sp. SbOxS1]
MPISPRQSLLCSYRYDALDRSIDWAPIGQAGIQRFHCKDRLTTEIQDSVKNSIFQHDVQVLAQRQHMDNKIDITLLTTDLQGSVLNALDAHRLHPIAYTPYGHRLPSNGLLRLLAYNGERPDPVTGHYHLGNGYRQFNPVLMRFNSPDSLSPFKKGGVNAYAYCSGNPVLNTDPTGRTLEAILNTMKSSIKFRAGNGMLSTATVEAVTKLQPSTPYTLRFESTRKVAEKLISDNRVLVPDEVELLRYQSATRGQAPDLLPQAQGYMSQITRRLDIVNDASYLLTRSTEARVATSMDVFRLQLKVAIMDLKVIGRPLPVSSSIPATSIYNDTLFPRYVPIPRVRLEKAAKTLRQP